VPWVNVDVVAMNSKLREFHEAGFAVLPEVSSEELVLLRHFLTEKFVAIMRRNSIDFETIVPSRNITDYHLSAYQIDHESVWVKNSRLLSSADIDFFLKSFSFIDRLRSIIGDFEIADIEGLGRPEIYWRLARPGGLDLAPAHKDSWFWALTNNLKPEEQAGLAKVWIPVFTDIDESGLSVVPGSHRLDLPFGVEIRHGRPKPTIDTHSIEELNFFKVPVPDGGMILFDRDLLHKGVSGVGKATRVSMEFAIKSTTLFA